MGSTHNLTFPPEIWRSVFRSVKTHADLTHLWTDCRRISGTVQDEVEHVFQTKHLPKVVISFGLGWYYPKGYTNGVTKVNLEHVSFRYDRLAGEGALAVFKLDQCADDRSRPEIMRRVSRCVSVPKSGFSDVHYSISPYMDRPRYQISIRQGVNDTELPSLALNKQKGELCFDWRGAFTHFYAEEKLYFEYLKPRVGAFGFSEAQMLAVESVARENTMSVAMKAAMAICSNAMDDSRELARYRRLRQQWRAAGVSEEHIANGHTALAKRIENVALMSLKLSRSALGDEEEDAGAED